MPTHVNVLFTLFFTVTTGLEKLKLTVTTPSGLLEGSVTRTRRKRLCSKVSSYKNKNLGSGFILGTDQSGRVELMPTPE